ncbi:hypothetical protein JNB62_04880 [Microbacterium jejuense]|uniref:MatE family transporter n=1 Tax=Microbacterium jejuense TaxID=1263637 RepID=A0ABS7HLS8_9MICO|nr:hypothetical protein [Microbacterium jejuense]MBW9093009.1 hypothetical protein [Microbacterium jejuense]
MEPQHENTEGVSVPGEDASTGPLSNSEALRKDMSYSPASESETSQKQADPLPDALDGDVDPDDVRVTPGTGGPDDEGDVAVDPDDLNLPTSPRESS